MSDRPLRNINLSTPHDGTDEQKPLEDHKYRSPIRGMIMPKTLLGGLAYVVNSQRFSFRAILSDRRTLFSGSFRLKTNEDDYRYSLIIIHAIQRTLFPTYSRKRAWNIDRRYVPASTSCYIPWLVTGVRLFLTCLACWRLTSILFAAPRQASHCHPCPLLLSQNSHAALYRIPSRPDMCILKAGTCSSP